MAIARERFNITIKKWPNKVPIGMSKPKYFSKSSKPPKKLYPNAVLKRFGKSTMYWVDKKTLKRIIKSPGVQKYWNLNGQSLYSGNMHWKLRSTVVNFYHALFKRELKKQIKNILPTYLSYSLSISVDIYEIYSKSTPDVTNMWLLEKMFEDSMTEAGIIRDDSPEFVMESGRKRYHWVDDEEKRKLIFRIKYIKVKENER